MELIKLKLRGLGRIPETSWCDLEGRISLFHIADATTRHAFIEATQTINPPYDCLEQGVFSDLPDTVVQHGYSRKIQPHKRSIAIGVFSTTPELVRILSPLSSHFYELDRVEVGRRLDYSRWINYVELASSTRWSEVAETMWTLFRKRGGGNAELAELLPGLVPTDRIKGAVMDQLGGWLEELLPGLDEQEREQCQELLDAIRRADQFSRAKRVTKSYLPYFLAIDLGRQLQTTAHLEGDDPLSFLLTRLYLDGAGGKEKHTGSLTAGFCNSVLASCAPELPLHFKQQEARVGLTSQDGSSPWLRDGVGVEALLLYARLLTALHKEVASTAPILLLHNNTKLVAEAAEKLGTICQCLWFTEGREMVPDIDGIQHHDFDAIAVHRDAP